MNAIRSMLKFVGGVVVAVPMVFGGEVAAVEMPLVDFSLAEFPRSEGEKDDTARLQRLIDAAAPHGVAYVPRGVYLLSSTLMVTNGTSILMHKSAVLRATKSMDYVLRIDLARQWKPMVRKEGKGVNGAAPAAEDRQEDYNGFLIGGQIDGNGLASCVALDNYHHFTLRDTTFLNGLKSGLNLGHFGHGYEVIANNLYFKTVIHGCKGNIAILQEEWDSHFTDCVIVDYTIGVRTHGGSNRFTRCHVWGGPIREMLEDSINFDVRGGSDIFRDCYCDTGKIGFRVDGQCRISGCEYFSNPVFGLNGITCIEHIGGRLTVDSGFFIKTAKDVTLYKGCGDVVWENCDVKGFSPEETPWNSLAVKEPVYPVYCWYYRKFEQVEDLGYLIDNYLQLGITHPFAPVVSEKTDKAAFRRFLDRCAEKGLKMILTDRRIGPSAVEAFVKSGDEAAYRAACRAVKADWDDHPAVFGYYVYDEPRPAAFQRVCRAAKLVGEEFPGKQPFLNHNPFFESEQVRKTLGLDYKVDDIKSFLTQSQKESELSFMGYDCYSQMSPGTNGYDLCFFNLRGWSDYARETGMRWNVTMLCTEHFDYLIRSEADYRWQISVAAAMGANAINWFYPDHTGDGHGNYRNAPISQLGERTENFTWMGREMRIFQHQFGSLFAGAKLERAMMVGQSFGGIPLFTGDDEAVKLVESCEDAPDSPLMVSFFRDKDGRRFFAIVNLGKEVADSRQVRLVVAKNVKLMQKQWDDWREFSTCDYGEMGNAAYFWMAPGQLWVFRTE